MDKLLTSCSSMCLRKILTKVGPNGDHVVTPSICLCKLSLYIKIFCVAIAISIVKIFGLIGGIALSSL